jgi:hypothetical protein
VSPWTTRSPTNHTYKPQRLRNKTSWGFDEQTLRIASLALVNSTAEYCAPVWLNSVHTSRVDIQLNNAFRLISGTLKSTQLPWFPLLTAMLRVRPSKLRREAAVVRKLVNCRRHAKSLLFGKLQHFSYHRLRLRKSTKTQ